MPLFQRMSCRMSNISVRNSDDLCVSLDEIKSTKFTSDEPEGEEIVLKIEMYLDGDSKGLF